MMAIRAFACALLLKGDAQRAVVFRHEFTLLN